MAFELTITFLQQNDNKALQITDTAGTYVVTDNEEGWGSPNPDVTNIIVSTDTTGGKYHLLLDVTHTGSDVVSAIYDQINLYDHSGPFTTAADLVFLISPADLIADGVAMGDTDSTMPDGKYDFVYQLVAADNHSTITDTLSESILLDGIVRVKIYDQLRQVPTIYNSTEEFVPIYHHSFRVILNTELKKGMFDGMLALVSDARTDEVLDTLDVIERLTIND